MSRSQSCERERKRKESARRVDVRLQEGPKTHATSAVIASADDLVPGDFNTSDGMLMSGEKMKEDALLNVPDAKRRVSRARDGDGTTVKNFEASNR